MTELLDADESDIGAVAFSGLTLLHGDRFVSASDGGAIVWQLSTGQPLQTLAGHDGGVECLCLLPDGRLISGCTDYSCAFGARTDKLRKSD